MEEIADARIIAVAVDDLAAKVVCVVAQFVLNIAKLRVEFVLFIGLGFVQVAVSGHDASSLLIVGETSLAPPATPQAVCLPPDSAGGTKGG